MAAPENKVSLFVEAVEKVRRSASRAWQMR